MKLFSTISTVALAAVLMCQTAWGQQTDPLAELLMKKGVVTEDDFGALAKDRAGLLDVLVNKGLLSEEDALVIKMQESKKDYATKAEVAAVRDEVQAVVSEAGGYGLPSWLEGMKIKGDVRLRYESIDNDSGNDTSRFRYRLRVGLEKGFDNGLAAGFRLASAAASSGSPTTSTNVTLGGSFDNDPISIDRGYIKYAPETLEWLELAGGRVANPFLSTDIVWDSDLNFDGFVEKFTLPVSEDFEVFATLTQFALNQPGSSSTDSYLWGFQGGASLDFTDILGTELGIAYYNFQNQNGAGLNARTNTDVDGIGGPDFEFRIVDIVNKFKLEVAEMPLSLWWSVVMNAANDTPATQLNEDMAWGVGAKLGKMKKKGSWEASLAYKNIEQDAVLASMNDQDFRRTNRKGIKLGGGYQLLDNLSLKATLFLTDKVEDTLNGDVDRQHLQLDAIVKF